MHTISHQIAAQVGMEAASSDPSMRNTNPARRLMQAQAAAVAAGGTEVQDVDMLTVSLPVLSFRPTPRSKRRQPGRTEPAILTTLPSPGNNMAGATSPTTVAPPEDKLNANASAEAEVHPASSSEEDEDWSYPALDLTASRDEASKILQMKAAAALASAVATAEDAEGDEGAAPLLAASTERHTSAQSEDVNAEGDEASDSNSDHEIWSYPPLQHRPVPQPQPQAQDSKVQADIDRIHASLPAVKGAVPDPLLAEEQSEEPSEDQAAHKPSDGPADIHRGGDVRSELPDYPSIVTPAASVQEPLQMMYSNAAFNYSRISTSSTEYDARLHSDPSEYCLHHDEPPDLPVAGLGKDHMLEAHWNESASQCTASQKPAQDFPVSSATRTDSGSFHMEHTVMEAAAFDPLQLSSCEGDDRLQEPKQMTGSARLEHASLSSPLGQQQQQQQQQQPPTDSVNEAVQDHTGQQSGFVDPVQSLLSFQLPALEPVSVAAMAKSTPGQPMPALSTLSNGDSSQAFDTYADASFGLQIGIESQSTQQQNGYPAQPVSSLAPIKTQPPERANSAASRVYGKWKLSRILGSSPNDSPVRGKASSSSPKATSNQPSRIKAMWNPRSQR